MEFEEFTRRLWTEYPRDLCHNRPGTKPLMERAAKKIKKSEYNQILLDIDALKRYDRKDINPDRWPAISVFLNQQRWTRLVDSVMEVQKKAEKKPRAVCQCGQFVDIVPTGECAECYATRNDRWLHKRKDALMNLCLYSPGQSRREVIENCKAEMLTKVKSGEVYKTQKIPFLKNLLPDSVKESEPSSTKIIYGEEWFRENADRLYGTLGIKFKV